MIPGIHPYTHTHTLAHTLCNTYVHVLIIDVDFQRFITFVVFEFSSRIIVDY